MVVIKLTQTNESNMISIKCENDVGGCVGIGKEVTCSYGVTSPGLLYTWVKLPNGKTVSLFVNVETNLVVLDICNKDGQTGTEVYRANVP